MIKIIKILLFLPIFGFSFLYTKAQDHSIARKWNEILLEAIRGDYARPTIHARNLFHISAAMYDAWAVYEPAADTYFLGKTIGDFEIPFSGFVFDPAQRSNLRQETMSYAVYHLMMHRFRNSPGFDNTKRLMDSLHTSLGYDINFQDADYTNKSAASLGVYIAEKIIQFGLQDGSNELGEYKNLFYAPVNEPLNLTLGGNNLLNDASRWQPLEFGESFVDQSGNVISPGVIDFLSPEWGEVVPFAMNNSSLKVFQRDGNYYKVYKDAGPPPPLDSIQHNSWDDAYKRNFALVAIWSGHLDPNDDVYWDISPKNLGNLDIKSLPEEFSDYNNVYDLLEGGDPGSGYNVNPFTGIAYLPQVVARGDYTRVLAEFWADGPDSETPPGHWFVILNYVSDHPECEKKFEGGGEILTPLEWDVKAYFILGGAMHDAAIAAWSIKGYYDYIRPISAIRYMSTLGQCSSPVLPRFHPGGMPLLDGYIELVTANDPLVGNNDQNLNKIKVRSWRGHDFVQDPDIETAGVGWILAENWWPYQRPSFVTPPFAGYVSGHSTFSRAAAEVLTLVTGSEYFPGGLGVFIAEKDNFLVFEKGPTSDVTLQWAKYYDASDQCSLSRIWGGIHPPIDDLKGRKIGAEIGKEAFATAKIYFQKNVLAIPEITADSYKLYPNPTSGKLFIVGENILLQTDDIVLTDALGRSMDISGFAINDTPDVLVVDLQSFNPGCYIIALSGHFIKRIIIK